MKTVVVPLDGSPLSERSIPIARTIAQRSGAGICLVEVVPAAEIAEARRYLTSMADRTSDVEVAVDVVVAEKGDDVADGICRAVASEDEPLVCMSTHGRSGFGAAVLGSTAEGVLHQIGRPLILVGRGCTLPWPGARHGVVVPVDGSERTDDIIGPVIDIVRRSGLEPTLVEVVHPFDNDAATHAGGALAHVREQLAAAGIDAKVEHRYSSSAAVTLAEMGRTWGAALIVMASYVPPGASRTLLGSVTISTVHHASCPVLVFPPTAAAVSSGPTRTARETAGS